MVKKHKALPMLKRERVISIEKQNLKLSETLLIFEVEA